MTLSPRSSRKSVVSTTRIARFISPARSHISCPVFFLAGLRGFAYSHGGVRPVPELAWHRLFIARTYQGIPGVVDGEEPGLLKSGSQCLCVAAMDEHYQWHYLVSMPMVIIFVGGNKKPALGGLI